MQAFTLVEMLIVIVIIGILISALMPRLQGAQGRARDVARQADLAQIQTAIINYQTQRGTYPFSGGTVWTTAIGVSAITNDLTTLGGLNGVPKDPNLSNEVTGLGNTSTDAGEYAYLVMTKNTIPSNGFVLMARVETEGGANWVYSGNVGKIGQGGITDIKDIRTCDTFTNWSAEIGTGNTAWQCKYSSVAELRYILTF